MPKSNKILTHKDQDSEYDKQRTNMGVRSGPKLPDRGQINAMTEDGTFNTSSGWTVTPGSLGDSDNWSISNGVATIDGSQSGTRWMIMDLPQNNYYKVIMTITRTAGTLSLSYGTGGTTSGTEMTNSVKYIHGPHQVTGNDILYIRADSSFSGTITDVKVIQTDANGVPVSHLLLCLDAMNAKSFAGEPATNLKGNEDFSTMSGYTGLDLVQVAEPQSPSGYACRMTLNSSLNNSAARSRFGSAGSIPTSGSGFVSVYVKGNRETELNGLRPSVYAGNGWFTLLPLDGGPNHITQEYRKFGLVVNFGTSSNGPNPGFSMVNATGENDATVAGARTFWIKPMVTTKDHSVPFTSGTRSSTDSWRDISGNGKHADHTSTDFGDSGDLELRQNGKILLPTDAADITASINFDGTNDYMAVSSNSDKFSAWTPSGSYNNNLTIEVWVKTSDSYAQIISKPWNGSGVYNYRLTTSGAFYVATNATAEVNVGNLYTGQWVHFVGVITPTHLYGYVNGDLKDDTSHSLTNTISSGEQNIGLLIGSLYPYGASWSGNTGFSLDGQIAVVKIYSAALSHADVRQSYNALKSRFRL